MKISLIMAHPDKDSLNSAIAKCCLETLEANGHTVYFHDLYAEEFDALLPAHEIPRITELPSELKQHCDEIASVDGIIVVHPNWWGQPPAILKGWMERVYKLMLPFTSTKIPSLFVAILFVIISGCGDGYLRGSVSKSPDGKTYLSVVDDNGGKCGPIFVDGKEWGYKINQPGLISPGIHTIECGTKIEFEIPKGVVFKFDYWGP